MQRANLFLLLVGLVLAGIAAPVSAAPARPAALLDFVEVLQGPVKVETRETWVVINFKEQDSERARTFRIDGADLDGPVALQASSSRILYWSGHLILLDQNAARAWHFWIPGMEENNKKRPGVRPETEGLKALLADYEVTRIVANEISSHSWKAPGISRLGAPVSAPFKDGPENQDPGGTCGTQCSITCGDGSFCDATCAPNRCASCTCPASCTCL